MPKERDGHFYWIDLLRFLAAFAVLACHFRGAFFVDYSNLPASQQNLVIFTFFSLTRLGHEAVLVFFVLSGFLVGGKALQRVNSNSFQLKGYIIDRMVRILLPLISSLLFFLLVLTVMGRDLRLFDLLGNFLSLQGILCAPYFETLWSLSYEVWFYVIIGAAGFCIINTGKNNGYIGLIILILCFLVFSKLQAYYLFIWLTGAFSYLLITEFKRLILYSTILISAILIGVMQLTSGSQAMDTEGTPLFRAIIEVIFGFFISIFVVQVIQSKPKYKATLWLNRIGTKLAAFSYTLYLTHIPLRDFLEWLGAPKSPSVNIISLLLYFAWLALAMTVAYGFYYVFERNTPVVKKYIRSVLS